MRNRLICIVLTIAALFVGLGGVAQATSGSCSDPPNDVRDQNGAVVGSGKLDIVSVSHADTSSKVTYGLTTKSGFAASDVDFIVWFIDANKDGKIDGYVFVQSDPLTAYVLDKDFNELEQDPVSHTDGSTVMSLSVTRKSLATIGVLKSYEYEVVAQESYYQDDGAGPCTHNLSSVVVPAGTLTLTSTTVKQGGTIGGTATGYKPGSQVSVYVHSTSVLLGSVTVDGTGKATFKFGLPSDLALGAHTIEVRGVDVNGTSRTETASFQLVSAGTTATLQKTGGPISKNFEVGLTILLLGLSWVTLAMYGRRRGRDEVIDATTVVDDPAELTGPIPVVRPIVPIYGVIPSRWRDLD